MCMLSCFGRVWPFVTLWTVARQAPLSMGFSRQRVLEWAAISSFRGSSWPRDWTQVSYVSALADGFFITSATWEAPKGQDGQRDTQGRRCGEVMQEDGHLQAKDWPRRDPSLPGLKRNKSCQALDFWLLVSRSVGQLYCCCLSHSVCATLYGSPSKPIHEFCTILAISC